MQDPSADMELSRPPGLKDGGAGEQRAEQRDRALRLFQFTHAGVRVYLQYIYVRACVRVGEGISSVCVCVCAGGNLFGYETTQTTTISSGNQNCEYIVHHPPMQAC